MGAALGVTVDHCYPWLLWLITAVHEVVLDPQSTWLKQILDLLIQGRPHEQPPQVHRGTGHNS